MKGSSLRAWILALMLATPSLAVAELRPRPLGADSRIQHVLYDPNHVVQVIGTYGYQTAIEFAEGEEVKVVTLGDTIAWQAVPFQNRLFLKPVETSAITNLTVVTSQRTYYFELRSTESVGRATYVVRFRYPTSGGVVGVLPIGTAAAAEPKAPALASKLNLRYVTFGDRQAIRLRNAFDDGQFTYFEFDTLAELPAIYVVNTDKTEALVNVRREGRYLVVEKVADAFTLRIAESALCVRNINGVPA